MPLPTTNLTLHLDASDTDTLFTTWADGGSHTGTPADGNAVQAWSRETDGSVNPAHATDGSARYPAYRSSTPLMLLPCLDFDGSDDQLQVVNDTNQTTYVGTSSFLGGQAKTILIAFYAESITDTAIGSHGLIGGDSSFGLCLRDVSGTKKVGAINNGGSDAVELTVSTATTHVACMRQDTSNIYLSVDGGAESSTASTFSSADSKITIARCFGSTVYNGRIGEIALYNAALTGSDLTDAIAYFRLKWQGVGGGSNSTSRRMLLGIG